MRDGSIGVFKDHALVASFPGDHRQYVQDQVDPAHEPENEHELRDHQRRLLVFGPDGHEVARYEWDEWDVASAPGDDAVCGGPPGVRCERCGVGDGQRR